MTTLPEGVGDIATIWDCESGSGLLIRLTREVDLDQLLADVAAQHGNSDDYDLDEPTILPGYTFRLGGREAQVGWFRKQACTDGDHSWDMAFVSDEKPEGNKRYGAFLGVFLG